MINNNVSTLVELGLMNPVEAVNQIVAAVPASEFDQFFMTVRNAIAERQSEMTKEVKRTKLPGSAKFLLKFDGREVIVKKKNPYRWEVYGVRHSAKGKAVYMTELLNAAVVADTVNSLAWKMRQGLI